MFNLIVTDIGMVDADGNMRKDATISSYHGLMYITCHPDLVDKVKEGVGFSLDINLEVYNQDEWRAYQEKEDNCVFGKSEGEKTPTVDSGDDIGINGDTPRQG